MIITLGTTTYYGDQLDIDLKQMPISGYHIEKYDCYCSDYGDGINYAFEFEDNAKSMAKALNSVAKLMKEEGLTPDISPKDIADLAKLLNDDLLGDEFYNNLKINLTLATEIVRSDYVDLSDGILTHPSCYSSGNNLCYFGEENAMALIRKPDEFKQRVIQHFIEKNNDKMLQFMGVDLEEIKSRKDKFRKQQLKKEIAYLNKEINKTTKNLEKSKAELKQLESEENEL